MPSPVRPNDLCSLIPGASDPACQSVKSVFREIPNLICDFLSWMLDANGNLSDDFITDIGATLAPPGVVLDYAGIAIPDGWLLCNGQAVSRTTYASLFATIGTVWGSGDGTTTFNVPNLQKRFTIGLFTGVNIGDFGGSADATVLNHSHGYGYFTSGNDNVWLTMEAYTFPEQMKAGFVRGDGSSWQGTTTINEGTEMDDDTGGTNGRPGLKTTVPIPEDTAAGTDLNMPPYAVVYKIIKT